MPDSQIIHSVNLFGKIVYDSVLFIHTVHSRAESFPVVSHTKIVARHFIIQKTIRALDEMSVYLNPL